MIEISQVNPLSLSSFLKQQPIHGSLSLSLCVRFELSLSLSIDNRQHDRHIVEKYYQ
jgi:hypothetical protein